MNLILEVTKADGAVTRSAIDQPKVKLAAAAGDKIRILDAATGKAPAGMKLEQNGDDLAIQNLPEGRSVEITDFYADCAPGQACSLTIDPADGGAVATLSGGAQPAVSADGQPLLYAQAAQTTQSDSSGGGAAPSASGGAAAGGVPSGVILGGLAVGGLALAAGGGSSGDDAPAEEPPPTEPPPTEPPPTEPPTDTTAPAAPVIAALAEGTVVNAAEAADGVTVTGTAEAGSTVAVTWGATTLSTTADASGAWTVAFTDAQVPADGSTTISAVATDAAGNASQPGTLAVGVDTAAPAAPTGTVGQTGTVTGTAEAGSTVALSVGGAVVATAVADSAGEFRMPQALASGATGTLTATDAAGNASTGTDVTASTYSVGTAGNDTVVDGGANTAFVGGGAGDDVLVGGNGGSVLNYQFDYWNAAESAVLFNLNSDYVTFSADANNGWNIGSTPSTYLADPAGTAVTQYTGGVDPVASGMQVQSNALTNGTEDDTGGGGRYYWDTVRNLDSGGSTISQNVLTATGAQYTLSIQASDADQSASLEVWWDGALLSQYDSITDTWTNPPVVDGLDTSGRQVLSWQVTATGESSALEIRAFSAVPDDGVGMSIDRVTLDPVAPDGAETLAGGQGADILFGQEGDDTLYGGDIGQSSGPDGAADTFVYTMRLDNGNDVIKDFEVGVDRIYLTDALDTYTADSLGPYDPNSPAAPFAASADENLSFRDFLVDDSATQFLSVSDSEGSVKITFTGQDATGAPVAVGSVVLEGVAYGTEAGQYDTVEDLFAAGMVSATSNGFDPIQLATVPVV